MPFTGKQRIAVLLAEKAKQQGLDPKERSHHKMDDMGQQILDMAKDGKYTNVNMPSKGKLLKESTHKDFFAMPKFQKLKGMLKF